MTSQPQPPAQTLMALLRERVAENRVAAITHKVQGAWQDLAWPDLYERVRQVSAGLAALGVGPGDRVGLFANTSLQWIVCDLAASSLRAVTVPVYASNTADEVHYVLENSGACVLFVDDDRADARQAGRLSRARARLADLPALRKVVLFEGTPASDRELTLAALVDAGKGEPKEAFEARADQVRPDDLCHFIYTSGTTGHPKGVMLTHGNWAYEARATEADDVMQDGDAVMLFLPLAHSFAQVVKAAWLGLGFRLVIAESIDQVVSNLLETSPTILPAVPRVFEKVFASVQGAALSKPGPQGLLARWAFRLFDEYVEARAAGRTYDTLGWSLAKALVFKKVRAQVSAKLGGRMRLFLSGGAPLSRKIAYFFDLLGLEVLEGYGLTETSAATTINRPGKIRIGTVGVPVSGTEVKIAPDGEVLIRGPGVMKGYYKAESATAEVLEPDGWFHSGDIGEIDADGYVRITDRKKDIIVTAGGKNIAPQNLENALKTHPIVSQAMVYGDKRPYLTALICVNEEAARKVAGSAPGIYAELARRPEVRAAVQAAVDAVNAGSPPYATLKRFVVMDHDFTTESGDLTPTLKVKRKACTQRYQDLLAGLYDERLVD